MVGKKKKIAQRNNAQTRKAEKQIKRAKRLVNLTRRLSRSPLAPICIWEAQALITLAVSAFNKGGFRDVSRLTADVRPALESIIPRWKTVQDYLTASLRG